MLKEEGPCQLGTDVGSTSPLQHCLPLSEESTEHHNVLGPALGPDWIAINETTQGFSVLSLQH